MQILAPSHTNYDIFLKKSKQLKKISTYPHLVTGLFKNAVFTKALVRLVFSNIFLHLHKCVNSINLTRFWLKFAFYTPSKHQKSFAFLMFSGNIK